jgi:hypothetical protein
MEMIRVNDNYNNAIYESRSFTFSVLLNGNEQLPVRNISSIEIIEIGQSDKSLKLGQFCNNQLTMKTWIKNDHIVNGYIEVFASLNGDDSMKVPLGKYYVNEYKDNHDSTYTITAYALHPRMNEVVKNINSRNVQTIVEQIETYTGMQVLNKTMFTLRTINEIEEHITYKQLLADIAGYDGYNLRVNREGNIVPYKYSMDVVDSSGNQPDIVFENARMSRKGRTISKLVTEKKVTIGSVKVSDGKNAYVAGTGEGISYINPYITAESTVPSYICDMEYVPLTATDVGNPCREIGDRVSFTDNKGNTFETWIMYQKISINGGLSMQTESYTNSNKLAVTKESPITKAIREANRSNRKLIEEMFGKIAGATDGYYNFIDGDGNIVPFTSNKIVGFQISNTPTITSTTKGWRFIRGGLYHSSDGFRTHDDFMLNEDGEINVNLIKLGNKTLTETISDLAEESKGSIKGTKQYYLQRQAADKPSKTDSGWTTEKPSTIVGQHMWYMLADVVNNGTEIKHEPFELTGIKGDTGRGIVGSPTLTYQASNSSATVPTGEWLNSIPLVNEGYTLWTKATWKYSDGTSSNVYSPSIAGKTGKGIKAVETEYYLSTSKTEVTGGEWKNTQPSKTADTWIWKRYRTTFTDESVGYSEPAKDDVLNGVYDVTASNKSAIEQLNNSVNLSVQETTAIKKSLQSTNDDLHALEAQTQQYATKAELQLTKDSINQTLTEEINGKTAVLKQIKLQSDGMHIQGKEGATTEQVLDEKSSKIVVNGKVMVDVNSTETRVQSLKAEGNFATGAHKFKRDMLKEISGEVVACTNIYWIGGE